jgi:hypothetical protein
VIDDGPLEPDIVPDPSPPEDSPGGPERMPDPEFDRPEGSEDVPPITPREDDAVLRGGQRGS